MGDGQRGKRAVANGAEAERRGMSRDVFACGARAGGEEGEGAACRGRVTCKTPLTELYICSYNKCREDTLCEREAHINVYHRTARKIKSS